MFKSILALVATVTAEECYEAVGTFNLNVAEGSVDTKMKVCWPKTSDNGALATGNGVYDDGSANGQAMKITHAWVADKKVLTLRIVEKFVRTLNYCSIMCELDEDAVCSGYLSCQPDVFGSVSFKFAVSEQTEELEPAPEQTEEPEPAPKARGKFGVTEEKEEPEPAPKARGKFGVTEEKEEPEPAPKAKGKFGVPEEKDEPEPAPKGKGKFGIPEEEEEPKPAFKARGKRN
jgi:hypothetical protein